MSTELVGLRKAALHSLFPFGCADKGLCFQARIVLLIGLLLEHPFHQR